MASDPPRPARPPLNPKPKDTHPRPGQFGHRTRAATHREVAARGGRKAHQLRTDSSGVHEFTPEEAVEAARKSSLLKRNQQEQDQRQQRIAERLATKGETSDHDPISDSDPD